MQADCRTSEHINGPCRHCVAGKMPEAPAPPSPTTPSSRVAELLHADLVSVISNKGRISFLILKDDFSDYTLGRRLPSKKKEDVLEGLTAMLNQFKAWGHEPGTLRTDAENVLKSFSSEINGLGWRKEFTCPGRHERKIERFIRDIRDGIRTVTNSLPYSLPRKLFPDLVSSLIASKNMIPSIKSAPITPQEIVVGNKPDMTLDLRARFGEIAIFKEPEPESDTSPRGEIGIVIGRDFYSRRGVKAYILSKRVMTRMKFQIINFTEDIAQEIAKIGSTDPPEDQQMISAVEGRFQRNRNGENGEDEPGVNPTDRLTSLRNINNPRPPALNQPTPRPPTPTSSQSLQPSPVLSASSPPSTPSLLPSPQSSEPVVQPSTPPMPSSSLAPINASTSKTNQRGTIEKRSDCITIKGEEIKLEGKILWFLAKLCIPDDSQGSKEEVFRSCD
jgi:hypothetical protein